MVVNPKSDEVTLSSREVEKVDGRRTYRLVLSGMHSFERTIVEPLSKEHDGSLFGPIVLSKAIEVRSSTRPAAVWAMGKGNEGLAATDLSDPGKVEDMIKTAHWVILLRIGMR